MDQAEGSENNYHGDARGSVIVETRKSVSCEKRRRRTSLCVRANEARDLSGRNERLAQGRQSIPVLPSEANMPQANHITERQSQRSLNHARKRPERQRPMPLHRPAACGAATPPRRISFPPSPPPPSSPLSRRVADEPRCRRLSFASTPSIPLARRRNRSGVRGPDEGYAAIDQGAGIETHRSNSTQGDAGRCTRGRCPVGASCATSRKWLGGLYPVMACPGNGVRSMKYCFITASSLLLQRRHVRLACIREDPLMICYRDHGRTWLRKRFGKCSACWRWSCTPS